MDYDKWQQWRKDLAELVRIDKSKNWKGTYPPHQIAVTEMAIRELHDRIEALEAGRGPRKPPKEIA